MKQKTNRLHFSTRTLAMVLSIVMLIGSIATGSMLNTFAAYLKDAAANSDAVSQAASEGSDIAKSAIPSQDADAAAQADNEEDKPDLSGFEENEIVRGMKNDLVALGAGANLAATGLDSGDGIHLGIGTTTTTWHSMGANEYEFTLDSAKTIYYTFSCSGSNFGKGSSTNAPTADSQETYTWYTDKTSSTQFSIALPAGTYKFKLKGVQSNNANCMEYQFWKVSGGSGGGGDDPVTPGEAVSDNDLIAVLKREKVYIYHGDKWGEGTKYVMKGTTTTQAASGTSEKLTIDNSDCHVAHSAIPVNAKYSISNSSSWSGMSINSGSNITTTQAGYLYYIYSESYGNNKLGTKSSKPTVTWNTSSATIKPGAASSSIKATVSGNTGAGRSSTVKYFYTADGTTFYTFDPANTSSFAPGTYTIYAAAYDTKIYVAAATTGTLTVLPKLASKLDIEADPDTLTAEGQSSTITVTASELVSGQNNLTYTLYKKGTSSDTQVAENSVTNGANTATFTVTPNARSTDYYATVAPTAGTTSYDAVQSGTVTISNTDEQYVPTYTVTFSSSNATYGTVTAKSTYKGTTTTLTSGDSVKEGASVTFTATEKTGGTFVNWSTFDTTATTVTRVIRAATTVQGVFGQKGYKLLIKNGTTVDMKELPNGTYISPSAYAKSTVFQIARNANSTKSLSSEATQGVAPDGTKYKVTSWTSGTTQSGNSFTTYNDQSGSLYIVYDPATDQVWLTGEPDDLYGVTVIAKNGTIRYGYSTADKYTSAFGDTTLTITDGEGTNIASHEAFGGLAEAVDLTAAQVRKGITLNVATQVDAAHVASGYYVKGFVVSGYEESFSVLMQDFDGNTDVTPTDVMNRINSGYNEFELTLDTYPAKNIEITPVYAIKETTAGANIRFYVDGFAGDVYKSWDGVIAVDAFNTSGDPILGEYPGQPMINYNGRYMVDLPRTGVTGITLNNYVWDRVHSNLFYGTTGVDAPTTDNKYLQKIQAANKQTYDFNDFVYLKQVMDADGEDEDIIFSFRHKYDENHNTVENSNLGQSTYYKDTPSTATTDFDYRKGFNTINPNDSIYQWENLTDFYDNRVDIFGDKIDIKNTQGESENQKAAYDNPIRIVSNGYDFSKAGKFATAWAVYAPVDANGEPAYNGAYDRYELVDVFGGQGKVSGGVGTWESSAYLVNPEHSDNLRDKYDEAYHNDGQHTPVANFVYDMAKIPTVISYEYAVYRNKSNLNLENTPDGDTKGDPGLRSDGRWFTTTSDQFLTAHTVVEYAEKDDDSLYHRDYFQSGGIDYTSGSEYDKTVNTGLSTGIKAYFENDDSDDGVDSGTGVAYQNTPGDTEAYAVSDGECTFNLKTVGDTNGDYVFKGWYLYSNGKYSFITREASYESEATANDVYVARYYKIPSGNVQITHKLHSDSTGFADCMAKVEVVNATNTNTHVGWVQQEFTSEAIKAGSQYIKSNSENALKITLKTEPDSVSKLDDFYESIVGEIAKLTGNSIADVTGSSVTLDKANNQATVIIPISSFFNNDEQTIKALPFFSKVSNIPHGDLTVSHEIDPDSTGTGVAKVRVQVLDGNNAQIYDSTQKTDETISLDSTYIRKGASYKINITLETQMGAFSKFNKFWVDYKGTPAQPTDLGSSTGPNGESCNENSSADKKTYTLTYNFLVDSLFNNNDELKFNELPFYSLIDKPDFKYELTYTYPAYNSSYGNQSYTVKGKFTDNELNSYMIYSNEELSFNTTVDEVRKRTFINGHAPYEDNFTKLIRYDNYSVPARVWDGATSTFKLGVTLDVKQEKVVASFKLPYAYDNATAFNPEPNINTNKVYYNSEAVAVPGLQEIYSRDWYATNGQRTASEDNIANAKFVKAPLILTDESTGNDIKYFQYWSVKTVAKYNQDSVEYTRCYDPEFNLAIFQDVIIEPIYSNAFPANMPNPPTSWDEYKRFDPDVLRNQDETGITITFLENSRNQYNNKAYGTGSGASSMSDQRKGAGDRIYSDFLLSFNGIAGNAVLKDKYAGQKKAGLIIEAVAEMDKNGSDEYITDASYYRSNTGKNVPAVPTAAIVAYLQGGTRPDGIVKSEFDVSALDNKNRIQFYYSLVNRPHKALNDSDPFMADGVYGNNNKKYFRAYAYIMDKDGTNIQISQNPVYFTIYDMATIENGKFETNTSN